MYPIFFSVASADIAFADKVCEGFPDDWVYLYSKSGEDGADIWEEISRRELPKSRILVVFWSRSYIVSKGCVREISQAIELVEQEYIRPVILRLDDCPISWKEEFDEATKPVFEALGGMLKYRTSPPVVTEQWAIELVLRVAEPILKSDHPIMPRHDLQQTLRRIVQKDRFSFFPAAWIAGFNGVGRQTLIREFNRNFVPNGRGVVIEVNEASLPRQVLLRIESEAFGADRNRLLKVNSTEFESDTKAVTEAVERVFKDGNYVMFRHSRIVEEAIELPEWLDDVVNALSPATRTKLFVISQLPLMADRRTRCREAMVSQRVPTVDDHHMTEFCYQLIGHFDGNPTRWTDDEVDRLVCASSGSIGFLVSLLRATAAIEDLDQIDALVAAESATMAEAMTVYVRWAFGQLRDLEDEQRTLLFLNDVSPCDAIDLERVINPKRSIQRVLGKLLELGLVERETDGLYRLTPLLAHRLSRDLLRPDLLRWLREALKTFATKPLEFETAEHEFIRIESRIQASLLADLEQLPNSVVAFVSAAHWLQAGIRLYHARRRDAAYRILKKVFERRSEFVQSSRVEITRYFCLSATRAREYKEAEACIQLLDGVHYTKAMAAFLRADLYEYQRQFLKAIPEYERAIKLNQGNDRRLERIYRPLIRCIIYTDLPDFKKAERYGLDNIRLRRTVFSLMSLARVYLQWKYRGASSGRDVPENIDKLYQDALADLEKHPGVGSAYFELRAEEAEFSGDFPSALDYMDKAVAVDPRFQLRSKRWRMMANSIVPDIAEQALSELDAAKNDPEFVWNWASVLPMLTETYVLALKAAGRPMGSVNQFAAGLPDSETGAIIARSRR